MERKYEVMFILRPDVIGEEADKLIAGFEAHHHQGQWQAGIERKAGKPQAGLHRPQVQRGQLQPVDRGSGWQPGGRTGAPPARDRACHQVHHRPHGRGRKAHQQDQEAAVTKIKQSTVNAQAAQAAQANAAAQNDPIKGNLIHIDMKRIAMDKMMRVEVPIQLLGVPVGVKTQGGILDQVLREIEIECLACGYSWTYRHRRQRAVIRHGDSCGRSAAQR